MNLLNSITYRITGLMFLAVALTVFLLIYLANVQMTESFHQYLMMQPMMMSPMSGHAGHMGSSEQNFLSSVHRSLIWVGLGILVLGLVASYALARSITVPLRNLSQAAEQIEQGNYNQKVSVETKDEVGQLAGVFNRMAEALAVNAKLRRQFLANIAHELRTPLAIIQGNLEGMVDGVIEPDKEQLSSLFEEALRLNRLIRDLRDLSLAEVRQLVLEKQPTDVNLLLQRAVSLLKPLFDEKEILVITDFGENLPELLIDSDRTSQVFYNILVNALRYSPKQSQVTVTTSQIKREQSMWLQITVSDQGPGIASEDLPYIFDHFYRSEKSRDRKQGGSGLGLAIVKQLVEIHGGHVSVESQLGQGSHFIVYLPIDPKK